MTVKNFILRVVKRLLLLVKRMWMKLMGVKDEDCCGWW